MQSLGPHTRVLAMDRRPDEPVEALGSRGLDAEGTAPVHHGFLQMIWTPRGGEALCTEPGDQRLAIGDGGFAEAQVLPNLRTVPLDGPTVPIILRPGVRGHANLLGEMVHDGEGDILRCLWERPSVLEELQQHGQPQTRCVLLRLDERPILREDGPVFRSFLGMPRTFHTLYPSVGGPRTLVHCAK